MREGRFGHLVGAVPARPQTDDPDELTRSPAVALLADRIRTHRPDLDLGADAMQRMAEITRRLDGLPLAPELAAARTRVMSLEEITAGLQNRFALLRSGPRDALPRQRTLRAVIGWSWELLDEVQRPAWASLAAFATPPTVPIVTATAWTTRCAPTVLVPATMELLGDRNWFLPRWLEWLPELHVESLTRSTCHGRS